MKTSRILFVAAFTLTVFSSAFAETVVEKWVHRYNGPANSIDYAIAIAVDSTGKVAVTGQSYAGGSPDYYTAKYSADNGALLWEKRYNGGANNTGDYAYSVAVDSAGNVAVTGYSWGGSSNNDY